MKRVGERRRPWIHDTRLRSRRRVFHTARHETQHSSVGLGYERRKTYTCTPYELLRIRIALTRLLARISSSFGRLLRPPRRYYGGRRGSLRRGLRALRDYRQVSNVSVRKNKTAALYECESYWMKGRGQVSKCESARKEGWKGCKILYNGERSIVLWQLNDTWMLVCVAIWYA